MAWARDENVWKNCRKLICTNANEQKQKQKSVKHQTATKVHFLHSLNWLSNSTHESQQEENCRRNHLKKKGWVGVRWTSKKEIFSGILLLFASKINNIIFQLEQKGKKKFFPNQESRKRKRSFLKYSWELLVEIIFAIFYGCQLDVTISKKKFKMRNLSFVLYGEKWNGKSFFYCLLVHEGKFILLNASHLGISFFPMILKIFFHYFNYDWLLKYFKFIFT